MLPIKCSFLMTSCYTFIEDSTHIIVGQGLLYCVMLWQASSCQKVILIYLYAGQCSLFIRNRDSFAVSDKAYMYL